MILVTPEGKQRKLKRISCTPTAGLILVAYLEQDRVIEESTEVAAFAAERPAYDIPMPVGVQMRIGVRNTTGGALPANITVHYDETP